MSGLNCAASVEALPSGIRYGEIVYDKANFGLLSIGIANYSIFGNGASILAGAPYLSLNAESFLLNGLALDDPLVIGDGLIPAGNQVFTQMSGFYGTKIPRLINQTNLVVHTGAPSQTVDLLQQLQVLAPGWFP